ncbi:MAG: hypothetical protein WA123_00785 [Methylotenera sp.]
MAAIKNKNYLANSQNLTTRYGNVPVIYVESEEDKYVFADCWFRDQLSKVEFKPASEKANTSGCTGVIQAVANEKQAGNSAWGIVDRDTTMSQNLWHLVDEIDDDKFEVAKPFGESIKVLNRWEMESYLVDAEALEHHRAAINKQSVRHLNDVHKELLDCCDALVPHAAINAVLHTKNLVGLGDGFTNRFASRKEVEVEIQSIKFPQLSESEQIDYQQHISKVEAFDNSAATNDELRVSSYLRRIYGKAVLSRFMCLHKIQVDLDGLLAKRIEEKDRVPKELSEFVNFVVTA